MTVDHPRRVRSFVRRPGRITTGQKRALDTLLPRWGVAYTESTSSPTEIFARDNTRVLDIGFGDGEALLSAAARYPEIDYLGVEVHEPGIGHLLTLIERADLSNIRIVQADAVDVVRHMLPTASFDAVNLFFPDPWPKKRHHKRRIVQPEFTRDIVRVLRPGGIFHVATDWADYAEQMGRVLESTNELVPVDADSVSENPIAYRAPTKFERRGRRLGHEVAEAYYRRR